MKRWLKREVQDFGLYIIPLIFVLGFLFTRLLPFLLYPMAPIQPELLTGVYDLRHTEGVYYGKTISAQSSDHTLLAYNVLGSVSEPKRIEIDLTNQKLYAIEGANKIFEFSISSGKMERTPTGTFHIWGKLRYATLEGGNALLGTYYYLPNVPYTMFFTNDTYGPQLGYSINGSYWQQTVGVPSTNGNISMNTTDAEKLFYWTNRQLGETPKALISQENPGTPVIIYGEAPSI